MVPQPAGAAAGWSVAREKCADELGPFLPADTVIVLGGDASHAAATPDADKRLRDIMAYLSDPEKASVCSQTRVIETPDYRPAEEAESLGKTRGVGNTEDTSDEAYMRRHARHERKEKKLRRQEKEALIRDQRKMAKRVAALEQIDATCFLDAVLARERERAQKDEAYRARTEGECRTHLEQLQASYLADARAMLARYDKLLPDEAKAQRSESPRSLSPPTRRTRLAVPAREPRGLAAKADAAGGCGCSNAEGHGGNASCGVYDEQLATAGAPDLGATRDALSPAQHAPAHRRISPRKRAHSAFGECIPDVVSRAESFDTAMTNWLLAPDTTP